jgi:putative endonuclease
MHFLQGLRGRRTEGPVSQLRRQPGQPADPAAPDAVEVSGVRHAGSSREVAMPIWSLYLLRCADGSLYTGISTDVRRRVEEHESGAKGAKYLRGRGPLKLIFQKQVGDRSRATWVELHVKKLPRADKNDLESLASRIDALLATRSPADSESSVII